MNFRDKNVLVVGAGVSGIAAVKLLAALNANVKLFDGKNDGLVGIDSFLLKDVDFHLIETPYERGISHGDMIDLNHENIKGFDVREFYVKVVNDLKERGF